MSTSLADALMATVPDRRKSRAARKDKIGERAARQRERKAQQDIKERERELADGRIKAKLRYERLKNLKLAKPPPALETPLPLPEPSHKDKFMDKAVQTSEDSPNLGTETKHLGNLHPCALPPRIRWRMQRAVDDEVVTVTRAMPENQKSTA